MNDFGFGSEVPGDVSSDGAVGAAAPDNPALRLGPVTLARNPLHLGLGASAEVLPDFDGTPAWYDRYSEATAGDGVEGRLVSMHSFHQPWDTWEMHPGGHEVVVCVAGHLRLTQEFPDGRTSVLTLLAGQAAINPPEVWHTVDVDGETTVVFITPGAGTLQRAR